MTTTPAPQIEQVGCRSAALPTGALPLSHGPFTTVFGNLSDRLTELVEVGRAEGCPLRGVFTFVLLPVAFG